MSHLHPWSENPWHIHTWISKNPLISTWISIIFGCQTSFIHTRVDIHINIQVRISMQGHSTMDIRKWISMSGYPCLYGYRSWIIHAFMDIHLDIIGFLWKSMHWLAMDSSIQGLDAHLWTAIGQQRRAWPARFNDHNFALRYRVLKFGFSTFFLVFFCSVATGARHWVPNQPLINPF